MKNWMCLSLILVVLAAMQACSSQSGPGTSTEIAEGVPAPIAITGSCRWAELAAGEHPVSDTFSPGGILQLEAQPDGLGGTLVVWVESLVRGADGRRQFVRTLAQRLDAGGEPLWSTGGMELVLGASPVRNVRESHVVADGIGGAVLLGSARNAVVVQRLDDRGRVDWFTEIRDSGHGWSEIFSGPDDTYYVMWAQSRDGFAGLRLQVLDWQGNPQWLLGGVPVAASSQIRPRLVTTPDGGAIVTILDSEGIVRSVHLDDSGFVLSQPPQTRPADGYIAASTLASRRDRRDGVAQIRYVVDFVPDGSGGALILSGLPEGALIDHDDSVDDPVLFPEAFRIDHVAADGNLVWEPDLDPRRGELSTRRNDGGFAQIVSDETGGAYIVWWHPGTRTVLAQRMNGDGQRLWGPEGLEIASGTDPVSEILAVPDDTGGLMVAWTEEFSPGERDIFAQRLDRDGHQAWGAPIAVSTALHDQFDLRVSTDRGDATILWCDRRKREDPDIFGRRLTSGGLFGCAN